MSSATVNERRGNERACVDGVKEIGGRGGGTKRSLKNPGRRGTKGADLARENLQLDRQYSTATNRFVVELETKTKLDVVFPPPSRLGMHPTPRSTYSGLVDSIPPLPRLGR